MNPGRNDLDLLIECHHALDDVLGRLMHAEPSFSPTKWMHWPTIGRLAARIRGAEKAAGAIAWANSDLSLSDYGSLLRAARRRSGLTQAQLGERVGTSAQHIGQFELGKRDLTVSWLLRLAAALGISPRLLLPNGGE